jgi:galactose mutarotase-like enzyme
MALHVGRHVNVIAIIKGSSGVQMQIATTEEAVQIAEGAAEVGSGAALAVATLLLWAGPP